MQLSIIIVNYNVKYFLEQCLCSVLKACKHVEAEIFVVDNLSTDGSRYYFAGKFSTVQFIWNDANIGFAKANNTALKMATGKFILFLNPDTLLPEDCIEKSIAFLQTSDKSGGLGIRMIDGTGAYLPESKRGFPTPITSLFKLMGMCRFFPKSAFFAKYYLGNLPEDCNNEIDVLAGAFMLIPKIVLDKIGSFDESFFMYGEDIDLSYRIQQAGYKNYYFADSTIIHFKGESTQKENKLYLNLFYGAMILFVKKHNNKYIAGLYIFVIQLALKLRAMLSLFDKIIKKVTGKTIKHQKIINSLIAAEKSTCENISKKLPTDGAQRAIEGNIVPLNDLNTNVLDTLSQIKLFITNHTTSEIIFCEPDISFKDIIYLVQALPKHIGFKFHAGGSNSIVGSCSKNSKGEFIALGDH